jgi:SAM-dependent methyltransferase
MAGEGQPETMKGAEEARLQRAQLEKYLEWVRTEGGIEGPNRLTTTFTPHHEELMMWLRHRCLGKILEFGCNYGIILAYCHGHIGIDINPQNIELARILNPAAEFIVSDIRCVPLPDKCVDTVMVPECLEHVPWVDVPGVISEAERLARTRVLYTVPNPDTETGHSFKHQWLCTTDKLMEIKKHLLKGAKVEITEYYIRINEGFL